MVLLNSNVPVRHTTVWHCFLKLNVGVTGGEIKAVVDSLLFCYVAFGYIHIQHYVDKRAHSSSLSIQPTKHWVVLALWDNQQFLMQMFWEMFLFSSPLCMKSILDCVNLPCKQVYSGWHLNDFLRNSSCPLLARCLQGLLADSLIPGNVALTSVSRHNCLCVKATVCSSGLVWAISSSHWHHVTCVWRTLFQCNLY